MSALESVLLGFVQGITEFLPISSSGHLEITQQLVGTRGADFHNFLELINIGTLAALMIFFRKRIINIIIDILTKKDYRLAINILLTSIPAGVMGLLLSDFIEKTPFFSSTLVIAVALGAVGAIMVVIDKLPKLSKLESERDLTKGRALTIGLVQVCALVPGVSRSGSTIVAGRLMGMDSRAAAEYSFLASLPIMGAVAAKSLISSSSRAYIANNFWMLALANLAAFAFGMIAINFVMKLLKKPGALKYFGYYRLALSTIILMLVFIR